MKWIQKVIQIQSCGCTNGIHQNKVDGSASHRLGLNFCGRQQRLINCRLHEWCCLDLMIPHFFQFLLFFLHFGFIFPLFFGLSLQGYLSPLQGGPCFSINVFQTSWRQYRPLHRRPSSFCTKIEANTICNSSRENARAASISSE